MYISMVNVENVGDVIERKATIHDRMVVYVMRWVWCSMKH